MSDKKGLSGTGKINGNFSGATEGEQNWAVRSYAEPFDAHILKKMGWEWGDKIANKLFHGGAAAFGNHLAWEFGKRDKDGKFKVERRIHSFTVAEDDDGNTIVATENDGTIFTLAVGGVIPFHEDPIYVMDPHATKEGQLQSADDDYINWNELPVLSLFLD